MFYIYQILTSYSNTCLSIENFSLHLIFRICHKTTNEHREKVHGGASNENDTQETSFLMNVI